MMVMKIIGADCVRSDDVDFTEMIGTPSKVKHCQHYSERSLLYHKCFKVHAPAPLDLWTFLRCLRFLSESEFY